jgi:hypothetical protein
MSATLTKALSEALTSPVSPARALGCCRVYITFAKADAKAVAKAASDCGKKFQVKAHYNLSNALYVGYDNCSGREIALAEAIKAKFAAIGVNGSVELEGD